jgi:hypothetical protein
MSFLHHKSPIRLWWRRHIFHLRQMSPIKFTFIFICILLLMIILPNPFSSQYQSLPLNQDAHWNTIDELLKIKEQVC